MENKKIGTRVIGVLVTLCLVASSTAFAPSQNLSVRSSRENVFDREAFANIAAWGWHLNPLTKELKNERKTVSRAVRSVRSRHRTRVLTAGFVGLALLLAVSPIYKNVVTSLVGDSERLTFLSLELISWGYGLFVSLLSQAYLAKESEDTFKLDWGMVRRQILLAGLFSTFFEGGYYENWLPFIFRGEGLLVALKRAGLDQVFSIFLLDAINRYVQTWIVEGESRQEAMHDIRRYSLKFYLKSAPLWLTIVIVANLFSRPIINFSILNIGMIIWEFQMNVSNQEPIHRVSRFSRQPPWSWIGQLARFYDRLTARILAHGSSRFVQEKILEAPWYETFLWVSAAIGMLGTLSWLTYPFWPYAVSAAIGALLIIFFWKGISQNRLLNTYTLLPRAA